jgi:hypothetical protein
MELQVMRNLTINLLALVFITLALLFTIPSAIASCVGYGLSALRWIFNKITAHVLKFVFAITGLSGSLSVMAGETSADAVMDLTSILLPFILKAAAANPIIATVLAVFAMAQPLIGYIANKTNNPKVNKVAIFGNKVLQTMTFNSSKNQPDVLSWKEMATTKPKRWADKIRDKVISNVIGQ